MDPAPHPVPDSVQSKAVETTWRVWATFSCTSTWAPCPGRASKRPPSARSTNASVRRRCRRPSRSSAKATPVSSPVGEAAGLGTPEGLSEGKTRPHSLCWTTAAAGVSHRLAVTARPLSRLISRGLRIRGKASSFPPCEPPLPSTQDRPVLTLLLTTRGGVPPTKQFSVTPIGCPVA